VNRGDELSAKTMDCPCGKMRIGGGSPAGRRCDPHPANEEYAECCGRYLEDGESAPTAEALMRSRYAAYVLRREDYLLQTWHPETRPGSLELADEAGQKWLGLEIRRHEQREPDRALVEFVARYKVAGRAYRLHEVSRFVRDAGRWLYVDGDIRDG